MDVQQALGQVNLPTSAAPTAVAAPAVSSPNIDQDLQAKIAQARQAGLPDDVIQKYAANYMMQKQNQPPDTSSQGGFHIGAILGGIGGGLLGGALGPAGAIGGSALGSGLGESLDESLNGKQGDTGEVAKQALLGGAGGAVGEVARPVLGALGGFLGNKAADAGTDLIASQYNVPRAIARSTQLKQSTIPALQRYGITDINDVIPAADQVTGSSGLLTEATREAVSGASPVPTDGITDMATKFAADPAIADSTGNKFLNFVQKGLNNLGMVGGKVENATPGIGAETAADNTATGLGSTPTLPGSGSMIESGAHPEKTFDFIQQLQSKAAELTGGKAANQITTQDAALARGYKGIASELEDRLYNDAGANDVAASSVTQNPYYLKQLSEVSPKLAQDFQGAQTVGDIRSLAAPFVRNKIAAQETEAGANTGSQTMGGTAKGIGKMVQNPLNLLAVPLGSDTVNAGVGNALMNVQKGLSLGPTGDVILPAAAQAGVRGALDNNPQDATGQSLPASPAQALSSDQTDQTQSPAINQAQRVRQAASAAMMKDIMLTGGRNSGAITQMANLLQPQMKLNTAEQNFLDQVPSTMGIVQQLGQQIQQTPPGAQNNIPGVEGFASYTNPQFAQMEQNMKQLQSQFAKLAVGGRVSNFDVQRFQSLVPTPTDSQATAQAKLSQLAGQLQTKLGTIQQNTGAGMNLPSSPSGVSFAQPTASMVPALGSMPASYSYGGY